MKFSNEQKKTLLKYDKLKKQGDIIIILGAIAVIAAAAFLAIGLLSDEKVVFVSLCALTAAFALVLFFTGAKYCAIYSKIKSDIRADRITTFTVTVEKARLKIYKNPGFAWLKLNIGQKGELCCILPWMLSVSCQKNASILTGLTMRVTFYEKSGCIISCDKEALLKKSLETGKLA